VTLLQQGAAGPAPHPNKILARSLLETLQKAVALAIGCVSRGMDLQDVFAVIEKYTKLTARTCRFIAS